MRKMVAITALVLVLGLSGCVNSAFLASSTAYQESTEPYLKMVLGSKLIQDGEKDSLKMNMEQYKKTIDKFNSQKKWYEF